MSVTKQKLKRLNNGGSYRLSYRGDSTLLRDSKRGDKAAFGELYLKYLDSIYRYIFFRVNQDHAEAEDLSEIVFFKAWDHIRKYHANGKTLKAWLYTIARNTVVDHWRKPNKNVKLVENIVDPNDVEEGLIKKDGREDLLEAINKLTDEQKQVITLKFIEGLKNKELVSILGKNEEAIRSLQYRALKQLRKLLS